MSKQLLGSIELNRIYQRDCIEGMRLIPDKSIDMILCDLPYGTTACKWDTIIPFEPLWEQYERVIKDNGAIVLTASQPFTTALIASNMRIFRYCWFWNKTYSTGFMNANKMPMRNVEEIAVFYRNLPTYNPQGVIAVNKQQVRRRDKETTIYNDMGLKDGEYTQKYTNYPTQVLTFGRGGKTLHPTQKPVDLFRYLIRTYTNPGEIILDNCMGSGTTAVAATLEGRYWVGFETEPKYVEIANMRLDSLEVTEPAAE